MNQVILTGNLGDDPKEAYTPDGVAITSFSMAFRSGKDKTSWIKVACYNKLAELCNKCLHKGARVGVIGLLDQQKWNDEHGNQKSAYRLMANQVEFIKTDGRGFAKQDGAEDNPSDSGEVPF